MQQKWLRIFLAISLLLPVSWPSAMLPCPGATIIPPVAGSVVDATKNDVHHRPIILRGATEGPDIPVKEKAVPTAQVVDTYGKLPLRFEANQGQTAGQVAFLSRGKGYSLFLTPSEAILILRQPQPGDTPHVPDMPATAASVAEPVARPMVRMQLLGAALSPQVVGLDELLGKVNYFRGRDPTQWRTNIPTYAKVKYPYPFTSVKQQLLVP